MAPPLIQLSEIALSFGGPALLESADLSVAMGERICLVGRNGSGKSTLLKIAAGLITPDKGKIFTQPSATIRYLPQEPDFSGFAHALDYVEAGLGPSDDTYRARDLLEHLGIDPESNPQGFSGGEARRLALARTLAPDPDVLLLDEPTNHLDLPTIEWLEQDIARRRAAIILISHDRRFLTNLSRQTIWLAAGPNAWNLDLPNLKPGVTKPWLRKSGTPISLNAKSRAKNIGCAMGLPQGANAMCGAWKICNPCARKTGNIRARRKTP